MPDIAQDELRAYFREIAHVPLLTAQQEIDLARRIELAGDAGRRLREAGGVAEANRAGLAGAEYRALAALVVDGREATQTFAHANLRLVVSIARRYTGRGLSLPDLIQEGNLGLLTAVRKFAWRKGYRFSTYATWWIRQALDRAIAAQSRTVRLPAYMHAAVRQLRRRRDELRRTLGRDARPGELAAALRVTEEGLAKIVAADRRMLSLDTPINGHEAAGVRLGDLLGDDATAPARVAEDHALAVDLERALLSLDEREAWVLRRRFGLDDGTSATLSEVGAELGLSRERVRQLEQAALAKLRAPAMRARLDGYRAVS